jgi:hypothetical protein
MHAAAHSRLALLAVVLAIAAPGWGIILHPDGEPAEWPDGLDLNVVGQWGANASAVAIGPNHILTTRHQKGGIGTEVSFDGQVFVVEHETPLGQADIRVARIATPDGGPANLSTCAGLYTSGSERNREFVVVGTGRTRGETILDAWDRPKGYAWSSTRDLLHGTNKVNSLSYGESVSGYTSDLLKADFDGPGAGGATSYEASVADHDSGGGWFIQSDGRWLVAGLSAYTTPHEGGESWFRPTPDTNSAIRVSSYAQDIAGAIQDWAVPPGDANWDGLVDHNDLETLRANFEAETLLPDSTWWRMGDFNADHAVDFSDYVILANWYGTDWRDGMTSSTQGGSTLLVPEPGVLILLLTAAAPALARRRRR